MASYSYRWPRPSVTTDNVIFSFRSNALQILLIRRKNDPFAGCWALPGGFVDQNEDLLHCAARELLEETSIPNLPLFQVGAFGKPGRDPRGHTVTVAYMSFLEESQSGVVQAADDAADANWFLLTALPPLAFDHDEIIQRAWNCIEFRQEGSSVLLCDKISGKSFGSAQNLAVSDALIQSPIFSALNVNNKTMDFSQEGLTNLLNLAHGQSLIVLQYVKNSPFVYADWWLKEVREEPVHVVLETLLVAFIIWLVMLNRLESKEDDPLKDLTKAEIDEIVRDWNPKPLAGPCISSNENAEIVIEKHVPGGFVIRGIEGTVIDFATFDFHGLSATKSSKQVAEKILKKYGCGACGPRGFYGTSDQHLTFEATLAKFMGVEETIAYSDSASTSSSAIAAFAKKGDVLIVDEHVNEALYLGCYLSRSTIIYYRHNDVNDLRRVLEEIAEKDKRHPSRKALQRRFIVTESIFRNTGKICPLAQIHELKKQHRVRLILDESLSFGVFGRNGRGLYEHVGIPVTEIDILLISLEASLGGIGGACIGDLEVVDHQRLSGAGYCFSASAPPFTAACATHALCAIVDNPTDTAVKLQNLAGRAVSMISNELGGLDGVEVISDEFSPVIHLKLSKTDSVVNVDYQAIVMSCARNGFGLACPEQTMGQLISQANKKERTIRICIHSGHTIEQISAMARCLKHVIQGTVGEPEVEVIHTPVSETKSKGSKKKNRN